MTESTEGRMRPTSNERGWWMVLGSGEGQIWGWSWCGESETKKLSQPRAKPKTRWQPPARMSILFFNPVNPWVGF